RPPAGAFLFPAISYRGARTPREGVRALGGSRLGAGARARTRASSLLRILSVSSPTSPLRTTPLHSVHRSLGATLVDFHGWEMPLRYGTIPEEHLRVRETAGVFDLCHMGRLLFTGAQAENWLQRVL